MTMLSEKVPPPNKMGGRTCHDRLPIAHYGDAVMKVRLNFGSDDASATKAAKNITSPALVINSSADDVTPQFMAEDICNALPEGAGELWTVDDCGHVEMWFYHNDEYRSHVLDLIACAHE